MMSGLSEAELHVQAMRLVCEALADREQQGIEVDWDVLRQMYDQMDAMLQALQHKHRYDSSDMVDLRKDRDAARAEVETLKGAMAADDQRLRDAEERVWPGETRGCDAPDAMADEILHLRQQLAAAQAAVTLQRAGVERLQTFVNFSRRLLGANMNYADVDRLLAALDELDGEPAPVAEPAPCHELDRLRSFAEKIRAAHHCDNWPSITIALDTLDAGTEPTPVAEPLDAEGGA